MIRTWLQTPLLLTFVLGSGCNQGRAGGHTKTYGGRRSEQPHDQYTAKGWKGGAKRVEGRQGWQKFQA